MMDNVQSFLSSRSRRELLAAGAGLALTRFAGAQTASPWDDLPRVLADIKLGRRSVLAYVLNPVTRVISDSLHEP